MVSSHVANPYLDTLFADQAPIDEVIHLYCLFSVVLV